MRNRNGCWCSTMATALALTLVPLAARAQEPPPVAPDDTFEPVEIPAPPALPEPEPVPVPEPVPEPTTPEPAVAPVEGPQAAPANPEQLEKIRAQRKSGVAVMATGGVVVAAGFGMTLAFTLLGDQAQRVDEPVLEDIERYDSIARVGGFVLASGVALVTVGGILFADANKKEKDRKATARVRMVPTLGGLVLSF